jgi:hypothetical protein
LTVTALKAQIADSIGLNDLKEISQNLNKINVFSN